jgi:hypothetical protein
MEQWPLQLCNGATRFLKARHSVSQITARIHSRWIESLVGPDGMIR